MMIWNTTALMKSLVINFDNLLSLEFCLISLNKVKYSYDKLVYVHLGVPLSIAKHFNAATVDKTRHYLEWTVLSEPIVFEVNL